MTTIGPEAYPLEKTRNIGISAHIDAGKTTLTERMLFYIGMIHKIGEVHENTTATDWMERERERGIMITSAATTCFREQKVHAEAGKLFQGQKMSINRIGAPWHVDFAGDAERSLRVLDRAIAVFRSVAGVQPLSDPVRHRWSVPIVASHTRSKGHNIQESPIIRCYNKFLCMKHTNTKTHRLLLNTTPEDRARIHALTLKSGADTESALVRQAFDFYILLHPRLAAGEEVFMRSENGRIGIDLDIPATWDGASESASSEGTGIRQRMELKLEAAQREQLDRLVEKNAAPTLTALAGIALTAYEDYIRHRDEGMRLYVRAVKGNETLIVPPAAPIERELAAAHGTTIQPMGAGYHPPQRVPVMEVLRQEAELDADLIVIDTPFSICARFPSLRDQIVRTMQNHHFGKNVTQIEFVKADRAGIDEMKTFLTTYLGGVLDANAFSAAQKERLTTLITNLDGQERTNAEADPIWALARPRVISQKAQIEFSVGVIGRMFDPPRWYARLKNGSYWGYEFVHYGADTSIADIVMNPMDPENVKTRIEMLNQLIPVGWNNAENDTAPLNSAHTPNTAKAAK